MLLFVGLGNPGAKHAGNRHNVGFMVVDAIAKRHGFPPWRRRFQGVVAEGEIGGERVRLLLPETFMNASGNAVAEAIRHSPAEIVAFVDWLQLPLGRVRVAKPGAGLGGHNGLRSMTAQIGNEYRQVRIGIGRPETKDMVHDYVLDDFEAHERGLVQAVTGAVAERAERLVRGEDSSFEDEVRLGLKAKGFDGPGR
jgi:PTH1 family peptidyl-tRNA hydrolase